jgi:hypothetical protein
METARISRISKTFSNISYSFCHSIKRSDVTSTLSMVNKFFKAIITTAFVLKHAGNVLFSTTHPAIKHIHKIGLNIVFILNAHRT